MELGVSLSNQSFALPCSAKGNKVRCISSRSFLPWNILQFPTKSRRKIFGSSVSRPSKRMKFLVDQFQVPIEPAVVGVDDSSSDDEDESSDSDSSGSKASEKDYAYEEASNEEMPDAEKPAEEERRKKNVEDPVDVDVDVVGIARAVAEKSKEKESTDETESEER